MGAGFLIAEQHQRGPSFDFAHGGTYSAKLSVNTAVESGTRLSQYWNVLQWKSKHSAGDDPFFILNVGNRTGGTMYFYLYDQQTQTSYGQSVQDITSAQWTHVEAHYVCAGDTSGHVTVWQNGLQILDVSNVQTRYSDGDCQWSVNNYSNGLSPSPAAIYIDDAAICSGGRCN